MSSRARLHVVVSVADKAAVDGVGQAPLETSQRFPVAFAGGSFAVVVGAAGGVMADLGDGHDVQAIVELAVPARDRRWRTTSPEDTSIGAVPV